MTQVSGAAGSADQRLRKLTEPEDPPPNRRISLIVQRLVPPNDSGSKPTAAFPGHFVFSHLRAFQNAGLFRFIPNLGPSGLAFAGIVAFWRNVRAARLCPVLRFVPPVGSFARDRNATERAFDSVSPPPCHRSGRTKVAFSPEKAGSERSTSTACA